MHQSVILALSGVLLLVPTMIAQSPPQGLQIVVRTELRRTDNAQVVPMRMKQLPDGQAEVEYLTDGRSVRAVLHGRMAMQTDGTITLAPDGNGPHSILNPTDRTYWLSTGKGNEPTGSSAAKVTVTPIGTAETIEGYHTFHVQVESRDTPPVPAGVTPMEQRIQIDSWCTTELKVPGLVVEALNGPVMAWLNQDATPQFNKACAVALRSSMRMSSMPDHEVRWSVISVRRVPAPPELFKVPAGYREVPKPLR